MSLVKADFKQAVIDAIEALSVGDRASMVVAHETWVSAIEQYIKDNLDIIGTYSGTLSGGGADPLSGQYTWKLTSLDINDAAVRDAAASGGTVDWASAIEDAIESAVVTGYDETGTINYTSSSDMRDYVFSMSHADFEGVPATFEDSIGVITGKIVDGFDGMVPFEPSGGGVSTGGGGTVTFTLVE